MYRQAAGESKAQAVSEPYAKWSPLGNGIYSRSYDMKIVNGTVYSRDYEVSDLPGQWLVNSEVPHEDQETISHAKPGAVPPGKYLMLGDHRNDSNDSHVFGFVPGANIRGKAIAIFLPRQRMGRL